MKCWEYLNCPEQTRISCPAFNLSNGKECWMVTGSSCHCGSVQKASIEEKLIECSRCRYYTEVLKKK